MSLHKILINLCGNVQFCVASLTRIIMSVMNENAWEEIPASLNGNGPNSSESICNIPNYPGVEIDIFRIVRDYFVNLIIPLIPYELYDSLVRLYIGSEFYDIVNRTPSASPLVSTDINCWLGDRDSFSTSASDSVEDLLLNMSVNGNQQTSTPCLGDCYNLPKVDSRSKLKQLEVCPEFKTPYGNLNFLCSAPPQSLKLDKLQEYTDFKESYLYPDFNVEDSTHVQKSTTTFGGTGSLNRKTLKSLKNRVKSNVKGSNSPCEMFFDNFSTPFMVFDKLLKSEELDNFLLPPNSCFETAFTSDSPKTRIIPQKSVDTIHFRNNIRPISIAVSSFANESKSCNNLNELKDVNYVNSTSYQNKINYQILSQYNLNSSLRNKSQSEGNLLSYFANSNNDISGVPLSPPEHFKDGDHYGKCKKKVEDAPKNSFATRLRDSLKRKRTKDLTKKVVNKKIYKHEYKYNSTDTLVSPRESEASYSSNASKLRTKSGGYQNPSMTLMSTRDDSSEIQSFVSLSLSDSVSAFANVSRSKEVLSLLDQSSSNSQLRISRPPSHSQSINSDLSNNFDAYLHLRKCTPSYSSQMQSEYSSASLRRNCCYRSKSATPTGCLSHSLASSFGNTVYHSALSGLNQTEFSRTSKNGIYTSENNKNISSICETATPPPTLPRRVPFINKPFNDSNIIADDLGLLHDYQNLNCDKKALSTSANELSDDWTDRTPFGRAPPYVHGGVWKHYYASPSKRLIGRHKGLEKFYGKKACLPGLLTKVGKGICIEALQLVLLLIEPQRKRALYLLLRMMNKVSSNDKLQLDKEVTNRALMVKTFARSVLLSEREVDYDEILVIRILTFMMDNQESIFLPPQQLAVLVHRKINAYKSLKHSNIEALSTKEVQEVYCQRVSPHTFEKQKLTGSQQFLFELLDQILDNPKLSDKEKKKKLKEFKIHYPEIYNCRFPPGKENQFVLPPEPKKRLRGFKKFASIKNLARTKSFRI